jgi:hypothetical protein
LRVGHRPAVDRGRHIDHRIACSAHHRDAAQRRSANAARRAQAVVSVRPSLASPLAGWLKMLVELMSPRSPAETWPGWNTAPSPPIPPRPPPG